MPTFQKSIQGNLDLFKAVPIFFYRSNLIFLDLCHKNVQKRKIYCSVLFIYLNFPVQLCVVIVFYSILLCYLASIKNEHELGLTPNQTKIDK